MKKADKKKAEDFVETLKDVHVAVKKTAEAGNKDMALELLEQCQSCAIQVGEMIETSEGGNCITVSLLESYCELVYQFYEEIRQSQTVSGSRLYNLLSETLVQIRKSVKDNIPVRKEAVFLPYKASMWDSLESVWKAAEEDPNFDAYVISIPYYDKNPDGSFREMHYEGNLYPDYVSITDYQDYDFEASHPDMIFIHNPYDDRNYVTSVHPYFFSKNLKRFTDSLVYIPYYIMEEIDLNDEKALEQMAHFCMGPGVINADKVIVQSENTRQAYIKILTKAAGEKTRTYWEEKILGLGSPKMDKVLETGKESQKMPEEWMRMIRKADGSWKKIILYNTSVSALLFYNEKMLEKMKDVFRIFKENQDEATLLWRPHPLIKATIESMRPQLLEEYERLVGQYQKEGWGIYDDSAELNRAIAICDGYYGDESSLVQLCRKVGKPVMIQNVEV